MLPMVVDGAPQLSRQDVHALAGRCRFIKLNIESQHLPAVAQQDRAERSHTREISRSRCCLLDIPIVCRVSVA